MAVSQTQYGKAYEYSCLVALEQRIRSVRPVTITANTSLSVAKSYWQALPLETQDTMGLSAIKGIETLIKMEPKILEDGEDTLELSLQQDSRGQQADVRDVLIIRRAINWEIGVSVKHNHEAVKHSRLSPGIDFGKEWFGIPCSEVYLQDIQPVFNILKTYVDLGQKWSAIPDKSTVVYKRLLDAFHKELTSLDANNPGLVPHKLLEYLLGREDFYKLISNDARRAITLQCFNLHGTLNKPSSLKSPSLKANPIRMPSRIYHFDYKETTNGKSDTTLELVMDEGWAVTFRLHNASTLVEQSLKFDIQLVGVPSSLFTHHEQW